MALHVFEDSAQRSTFIICVVSMPICTGATIFRFVSTRKAQRTIGWEDWFALLALVFYLSYTSMTLWIVVAQNGRNVFVHGAIPHSTVVTILKVGYAMNPQFSMNQTFAKMSLLALYLRIFSVSRPCRLWVYFIGFTQILWFLAMFFIRWFMCTPVYKVWTPTAPGTCINNQVLLVAGEAVNSVIDFAMVILALSLVRTLMLPTTTKWKLYILFAIGGFSGVIGFIKIGRAFGKVGVDSTDLIWTILQMATSIICCCAPIYKSLLPQMHIFETLRSKLKGSSSTSSNPKEASQKQRRETEKWLRMDESSTRGLAWAEVETRSHSRSHSNRDCPIRTVQIHQDLEMV